MWRPLAVVFALAALALPISPAHAVVISTTNSTFGVVDESADTRDLIFSAGDFAGTDGIIDKVTISISFAKCTESVGPGGCFGATATDGNPFAEEIQFVLTSPTATSIRLIGDDDNDGTFISGGNGDIDVTVLFDDAGAPLPSDVPVDGTFAPENALSAFIGENSIGIWVLTFSDLASSDPLGFFSATLNIEVTETATTSVPEPAAMALFGAGLLGLAGIRRRRQRR